MTRQEDGGAALSRRTLVGAIAAGAAAAGSHRALAQAERGVPPSVVTSPPRQFGPHAPPNVYLDPDIVIVDPLFTQYVQGNAPIQRLWTGALWSEGPAWSGQGRYLVWSDIPNNRQLRWLEENGQVGVFRTPSNNSNGNTFDFQGRQISCEHLTRRVVRYEHDGSVTVIADSFNGKRLNSPNDAVPHPDGSIWFTDPPYGGQLYEGEPDAAGGPSNPSGRINPRFGQPAGFVGGKRELPTNVYRADPGGSTSSLPRTSSPTRTDSASRTTTRSFTSSAPARARATQEPAASATCMPSRSGRTTSSRTKSSSPTLWSTE